MIFDIGANIGEWSKANIEKYGKIIAVEASPITFQKLVENVADERITVLNYAVCNNGGRDITFYHAESDVLSTINKDWLVRSASRFYNQPYKEIICKTITIDDLIEQYGTPDLIKIDVEGGEFECVSSLTKKVNTLCFEWASEVNSITFNCLDYLSSIGFSKFYIQYGDDYRFCPQESEYIDMGCVKDILCETTPRNEWGMMWCK